MKDQHESSLLWMKEFQEKKAEGHETVAQKHLLKGNTERAEMHRSLAREYAQKKEEIETFLCTRTN